MRTIYIGKDLKEKEKFLDLAKKVPQIELKQCFGEWEEALDYVREHRSSENMINLVFLEEDWGMRSGIGLVKRLKAVDRGIWIVMLAEDERHSLEAIQARMNAFLIKPCTVEDIRGEADYIILRYHDRNLQKVRGE